MPEQQYQVLAGVIARNQVEALETALELAGWQEQVLCDAGGPEVEWSFYLDLQRHPDLEGLRRILQQTGACIQRDDTALAAELLAGVFPDQPWELSPGVWVVPDRTRIPPGRPKKHIHIKTGPAFGDGHHPTTRMLAQILLRSQLRRRRVLDLGCGTGILGIIAAQRGAQVDLADLDPASVESAAGNCRDNRVTPHRLLTGDLLEALPAEAHYDLVVANLYYDLLIRLAADPRLRQICINGELLASGVGQAYIEPVKKAWKAAGLRLTWEHCDGWWWAARARIPALQP